eukprot:5104711-Pyramimonas_sp.AAC.1
MSQTCANQGAPPSSYCSSGTTGSKGAWNHQAVPPMHRRRVSDRLDRTRVPSRHHHRGRGRRRLNRHGVSRSTRLHTD